MIGRHKSLDLADGDHLHIAGQGEDGSGGCMVIHETTATRKIISL